MRSCLLLRVAPLVLLAPPQKGASLLSTYAHVEPFQSSVLVARRTSVHNMSILIPATSSLYNVPQVHTSSHGPLQRERMPAVQTALLASASSTLKTANCTVLLQNADARHLMTMHGLLSQECPQLSAAVGCLRLDQPGQLPRTADFLCGACEQLLWRPAVLTCGHAVCGECLPGHVDASARCTVCQLPIRALPSTCKLVRLTQKALLGSLRGFQQSRLTPIKQPKLDELHAAVARGAGGLVPSRDGAQSTASGQVPAGAPRQAG